MPSVKNQDKRDMDGIIGNANENKTKCNSFLLKRKSKKLAVAGKRCRKLGFFSFRERESSFSLDFWPFGPSVLNEARSKVDLRGEGYPWAPIWWSFDNSKR